MQWELLHTLHFNYLFVLKQISGCNVLPLYTETPWSHDNQNTLTHSFFSIWLLNLREKNAEVAQYGPRA